MYVPDVFREERPDVLHDAIRAIRLATIVSQGRELMANHLPLLLDTATGTHGTLYGHMALANPHWREIAADGRVLVLFLGPNAYISPSHYWSKAATGKVVPTWNYVAVHVYGTATIFDDTEELRRHVEALTIFNESSRPLQWRVDDAPADYVPAMIKGIVGVAIAIDRIEGKWKMSQNRPAADRVGVAQGLAASDRADDRAIAEAVAASKSDRRSND